MSAKQKHYVLKRFYHTECLGIIFYVILIRTLTQKCYINSTLYVP